MLHETLSAGLLAGFSAERVFSGNANRLVAAGTPEGYHK
jgi:hypothetical protein